MKLMKLMLSAVAAVLVLASCNKENTSVTENPNLKTVELSLNNVMTLTKSPGTTNDLNGTKIVLNSVQFFFSDGTSIYEVKNADGTVADTYLTDAELSGIGNLAYHFIPAAANRVFAIGNSPEISASNVTEIMRTLEISEQQDPDNLTLYAAQMIVNKSTGHPAHPETDVYTVQLDLKPRIARIEVQGAECTFSSPALYDKIAIKTLAFVDYYQNCNLRTGEVSNPFELTLNDTSVHNYFSSLPSSGVWNFDNTPVVLSPATSTDPDANMVGKSDFNFAYDFFPGEGVYPRLVADVVTTSGGTDASAYLATLGFHDSSNAHIGAADFKPGYIYRLSFNFKDTDLDHHDRCVEMSVTVASWQLVTVTPVF